MSVDLYALLHVAPDAPARTIRDAYRALARSHHPDLGGDAVTMACLNEAWHILGNVERRAAYDAQCARERWQPVGRARVDAAPLPKRRRAPVRSTSTVLDFGRHAGLSIEALAVHDPDYLDWLARTPIGRPLRTEIADALAAARAAEAAVAAPPRPARQSRTRFGWLAR